MSILPKLRWLIYVQPLHKIIIYAIIAVVLWALVSTVFVKKRWWRMLNAVGCLISLAAVLYLTVVRGEGGTTEVILQPFHSFIEAEVQPELYRSMLMNVFLFVPFGMTLPFVIRGKLRVPVTVIAALCLSVAVEFIQYRFSLGRCEVDDVICNTLGGLFGSLCVPLSHLITPVLQRLKS